MHAVVRWIKSSTAGLLNLRSSSFGRPVATLFGEALAEAAGGDALRRSHPQEAALTVLIAARLLKDIPTLAASEMLPLNYGSFRV
jgi:hypothetical protein